MLKKIGIMGLGMVGGNLFNWMERNLGYELIGYDPPKGIGTLEKLNEAEVVFVCVPTPYNTKGDGFDLSYVKQAISSLTGNKYVIIKSTVLPGTTDDLQKEYPQHNFLFNPEFLTEANAGHDMANPNRQILGMSEAYEAKYNNNEAERGMTDIILKLLPYAPFRVYTSAKAAEMVKYFGNTWYATKVVFANQMYDLCQKMGINYKMVKQCASQEPMIGKNHLDIFHNMKRGYSGKCLPKDTRALIQLGDKIGVEMELLKTVEKINNTLVKNE